MLLTEEQKKRTKQLEDLGYEVLGDRISKISGRTSFYLADLTKEGKILQIDSGESSEALIFSTGLKKTCEENDWKYLENKKGLDAT